MQHPHASCCSHVAASKTCKMHAKRAEERAFSMQIGWRRVGWAEFFRTAPTLPETGAEGEGLQSRSQRSHVSSHAEQLHQQRPHIEGSAAQQDGQMGQCAESASTASSAHSTSRQDFVVPPAELIQPLYISKLNTVFQLGLIAGCISHSWYGWPSEQLLWGLGGTTALATVASFAAYVQVYRRGAMRTKI